MIEHKKEIILAEVGKLQRLNYNQFFWWRKFRSKQKELSKYAYAVDKIRLVVVFLVSMKCLICLIGVIEDNKYIVL